VVKQPIQRVAALVASLALAFAVVVPLHAHTCHWPSAASEGARLEPLPSEAGTAAGHEGVCLACTLYRRLQAPVSVGTVSLHATPVVADAALTPLPGRAACGVLRLTPPRGPPLSS